MSILSETLKKRDLFSQISNDQTEIKKIYVGFDGTAKSLQIGNLTPLAALKHLAKTGIQPIVLLGGATSRIGDPSGKKTTRKQLETNEVTENISILENQIKKLLPNATIVNNFDWLSRLSFMDFLENITNLVSVSYLTNFKTFAERLKNNDPLTLKEFLYPMMQGYDFLYLYETMHCDAQLGGNDQWCNVLTGVDLIQKKHSKNTSVVAVTSPLLVDSNGNKMGKSLKGAIYLSEKLCSVYDFWHFWRNIPDDIVTNCLYRLTDFETSEISEWIAQDINHAKIQLADSLTNWVHSKEDAQKAKKQANTIFVEKNFDQLEIIAVQTSKLFEIIAQLKNISNSEAKKLIQNNAIKINEEKISNISYLIEKGKESIISIGKKDVFKIISL